MRRYKLTHTDTRIYLVIYLLENMNRKKTKFDKKFFFKRLFSDGCEKVY